VTFLSTSSLVSHVLTMKAGYASACFFLGGPTGDEFWTSKARVQARRRGLSLAVTDSWATERKRSPVKNSYGDIFETWHPACLVVLVVHCWRFCTLTIHPLPLESFAEPRLVYALPSWAK
jgi:hypothetical protein